MFGAGVPLSYKSLSHCYALLRNMVAAGCNVATIDPIDGKADLRDGVIWRPFAPRIVHESVMIASRDHAPGEGRAEMQASIRRHIAPFMILDGASEILTKG